jgi:hypothetical protein
VARHLNVDRSAVSRAARRVENDPDLIESARAIFGLVESEAMQH